RNPYSTRPYEHVLEPVFAYLMIAMEQVLNPSLAGSYNIGPADEDCINTGRIADLFVDNWGSPASWKNISEANAPHEAAFLKLDCAKARRTFEWEPAWHIDTAVAKTVEWYKAWNSGEDMRKVTISQIKEYIM
ncbi:MAG: CDP-glucose 4,6-dehydratase, partial [Lachnospiraceae bacterium]|nr:CDP-glucose 4,6-dehydratase [Lachnospiraceae bacterium]